MGDREPAGSARDAIAGSAPDRPGWIDPASWPALERDEVHVWRASLHRPGALADLFWTLSADERTRAGRFHFARDRDRFVAARGLLRAILGRYLGRDPAQLRFAYGSHGKPALAGADENALRFNVAHAGELGLYVAARDREVGVDIERDRTDVNVDALATSVLTPRERELLSALPGERHREAFFGLWTRKEAIAKAVGLRLALPPDGIEVGFPHERRAAVVPGHPSSAPGRWVVHPLDPGPSYAGAVAVDGEGWQLRCWQWPDETPFDRAG